MTAAGQSRGNAAGPPEMVGPGRDGDPVTISGWLLRSALALAVLAVVVISLLGGSGTGALTVAGLLLLGTGLATVARPGSHAAVFLLLVAMGLHLLFDAPQVDVGVAVLAAAVAAVHQLAGICATVPVAAVLELRALAPAAIRLAVAVGVVEVGLLAAALVGG